MDRSRVIMSIQELNRATYATYALKTYYNYIKAWAVCIERLYGSGDDEGNTFVDKFKTTAAFSRVEGGASISEEFSNAYSRGRLTLKAIEQLPIEEYPKLALSANFWLPVQSYYAIHGVGLAAMIILGRGSPQTHRSFRADFGDLVNRFYPEPLCGRCVGGPGPKNFSFQKLSTSIDKVTRQNQLADPTFVEEIENFIGKSLSTTREKFLQVRFDEKRVERRKKRLSYKEKNECCKREHSTSICDLIYRMRVRSNYDSPDMYLFASDDAENAIKHYRDLRYLTQILITGLDILIERRIGRLKMADLTSRF